MCLSAAGHFQAKFMKLRVRLIKYDKKKRRIHEKPSWLVDNT